MTTSLADFEHSLGAASPAPGSPLALQALWWSRNQDWSRAHDCVQADERDPACNWVHAHLHRVEGDMENAAYWYRLAGKPVATVATHAEWADIASALLA